MDDNQNIHHHAKIRARGSTRSGLAIRDTIEYYEKIWAQEFENDIDLWNRTGYNFGNIMQKAGLTNLTLLDGSKEMIKIARSKGIYTEIFEEILQPNTQSMCVPDNSFDLVIGLNCFFSGHLGEKHIPVLLNMLKPSGKLIMFQAETEQDRVGNGLHEWISKLEGMKICKLIKTEAFDFKFDTEKNEWEEAMYYIIQNLL